MVKKCKGCGAVLQDKDIKAPGYVKRMDQSYCMRCFRLTHYGDLIIDMKDAIEPQKVIDEIRAYKDIGIIFIIDILHLDSHVNRKIFHSLKDYPMIVIINKIDLLPDNINFSKLENYCNEILQDIACDNKIYSVILTYMKDKHFNELFFEDLKLIDTKKFICAGLANAGKSTILNKLLNDKLLTTSNYPGTTLDFNSFKYENYTFIDTPGLVDDGSILMHLKKEDINSLIPSRTMKPLIYQVYEDQSFFIEGIMQLDIQIENRGSVIFYFDPSISIHRVKKERANNYIARNPELFNKGYKLIKHSYDINGHQDLTINGLGFISFRNIAQIDILMIDSVELNIRKGLF